MRVRDHPEGSTGGVHIAFYTDVLDHAEGEFQPRTLEADRHMDDRDMRDWASQNARLLLLHEAAWAFGDSY